MVVLIAQVATAAVVGQAAHTVHPLANGKQHPGGLPCLGAMHKEGITHSKSTVGTGMAVHTVCHAVPVVSTRMALHLALLWGMVATVSCEVAMHRSKAGEAGPMEDSMSKWQLPQDI